MEGGGRICTAGRQVNEYDGETDHERVARLAESPTAENTATKEVVEAVVVVVVVVFVVLAVVVVLERVEEGSNPLQNDRSAIRRRLSLCLRGETG